MFPAAVTTIGDTVLSFFETQKWSLDIFNEVLNTLKSLPVEAVKLVDYDSAYKDRPELKLRLQEWHKQLARGVLPPMWLRSGRAGNIEEALGFVEEYEKDVDEAGKKGDVFPMPLVTLVARKRNLNDEVR